MPKDKAPDVPKEQDGSKPENSNVKVPEGPDSEKQVLPLTQFVDLFLVKNYLLAGQINHQGGH